MRSRPLRSFAEDLANRLGLEKGFSIVLVSDAAIRRYNREFRSKDAPTDVLSFPNQDSDGWDEHPYAGDILISIETAHRQAEGDLLRELKALTLHGLLHLMGLDHETDGGEMLELEEKIRREYSLR